MGPGQKWKVETLKRCLVKFTVDTFPRGHISKSFSDTYDIATNHVRLFVFIGLATD